MKQNPNKEGIKPTDSKEKGILVPNTNTDISYDRTVDIVRDAIPRMSEMKIPITPSNYAVWYEYLTDSNQDLCQEMDALLGGDQPITDSEMRALYERYLEERSEKLQEAKTALGQVVSTLMSHINHTDRHYSSFSTELSDITTILAGDSSAEDLNSLMDRAMRATHAALEHGVELKQKLSSLAYEMKAVRGKLSRSQDEARADALTGLYNRLAFQEKLAGLPGSAMEDTHAPCLLIIDIDFFKRVNDVYGHLAGDHVLKDVAQEIKESVRGRDMVARYGGEEFAILLRDIPRSGCQAVAENVRVSIERSIIDLPDNMATGQSLSVTVSIGGAWFRQQESIEAFIDRADRGLYLSKENGRNQVTWENLRTEA